MTEAMRCSLFLATFLMLSACRSRQTPTHAVDEHGRCDLSRRAGEIDACYAIRCAEDFVRRNGYTIKPPEGPIRPESIERHSLDETLADRRGTLEERAAGLLDKLIVSGHMVVFRRPSSRENSGRVVTMTKEFTNLVVAHQEMAWRSGLTMPECPQQAETPPAAVAKAESARSEASIELRQSTSITPPVLEALIRNQSYSLVTLFAEGTKDVQFLVHRQHELLVAPALEGLQREEFLAEIWKLDGTKRTTRLEIQDKGSASSIDAGNGLLIASSYGCCGATDTHAVYSIRNGQRLFFAGGDRDPYVLSINLANQDFTQLVGIHVSGSNRDSEVYAGLPTAKSKVRLMFTLAIARVTRETMILEVESPGSIQVRSARWRQAGTSADSRALTVFPAKGSTAYVAPRVVVTLGNRETIELVVEKDGFGPHRVSNPKKLMVRRLPFTPQ